MIDVPSIFLLPSFILLSLIASVLTISDRFLTESHSDSDQKCSIPDKYFDRAANPAEICTKFRKDPPRTKWIDENEGGSRERVPRARAAGKGKISEKSIVKVSDTRRTHFPSDDDSHNFPNYPLIYIPIPIPNLLIHHHARPGSIFREAVSSSRGVVKLAFPSPEPVSVRQRFLSFFSFFFFFFNETAQHSRNRAVPRVTCFT